MSSRQMRPSIRKHVLLNMTIRVKRVSKGFPKGFKLLKPGFHRASKRFVKSFQRVCQGFQIPETGFLKGFQRVCKERQVQNTGHRSQVIVLPIRKVSETGLRLAFKGVWDTFCVSKIMTCDL